MKAEHRHQLHTNLLADRMGRLFQSVKSTPKSTSALVWALVLLALGTLIVWKYWAHATQVEHSALWTDIDIATHDPRVGSGELLNIGSRGKGTIAGRTADFEAARMFLQSGEDSISAFRNDQAIRQVKDGLRLYQELLKQCPDAPLLEQEALMGIAKAKESLIGIPAEEPEDKRLEYGTLDQSLAAYQQLVKKFPNSSMGLEAARRVKEFEEKGPEIDKFYKDKLRAAAKPLPDMPKFTAPELPPFPVPANPK